MIGSVAGAKINFDSWIARSSDGVVWLRSPLLQREGFIHAFSTRIGGVSPAPFNGMNLGIADAPGEPDRIECVQENWRLLLAATNMSGHELVRVAQVHGSVVHQVDREENIVRASPPFVHGDAIISSDSRQALAIRVADCAPILIADIRSRTVAAVHAGWRGVVQEIVPAALRIFLERGSRAQDVRLAIGPCIQQQFFQIGEPVAQQFIGKGLSTCLMTDPTQNDRWRADLPRAIIHQANIFGLEPHQIDDCGACTYQNQALFHSYRRDGARSGRMAAVICSSLIANSS